MRAAVLKQNLGRRGTPPEVPLLPESFAARIATLLQTEGSTKRNGKES